MSWISNHEYKSEGKKFPFLLQSCRLQGQMDWWTMVVISNTVFSFIPNDPCPNTLRNCIMDDKLVNLKSVIYLMHGKYGNFSKLPLLSNQNSGKLFLWMILITVDAAAAGASVLLLGNSFVLNGYHVTLSVKMNFIAFKLFKIYFTSNRVWLSPLLG